jgi:hypothetical protein
MTWWQGTPMRLLQTNLREIDIPLDPQAYANIAADFDANVVLFNLGGIVANYPTRLPFHYRNPRLQGDIIAELIRQLHQRDIRFIGRFDFSKVNQEIGSAHPEWLYRSLRGETVTYNGQMHCCVNGVYQQEHAQAILSEALEMYPLDGVFFNMIGYQTHDYSGVYHGPCQCDACSARFRAYCGEDLPTREDRGDPVYQQYMRFCEETSRELFRRIRDRIKAKRADCAICTYISDGIDIVRSESNSGIRRVQPEFVYESSYHVRRVRGSWPKLAASNTAVHFIDYPYRHAAVSPALTTRRVAQNFIHGGWVDYYVIGRLEEQHDRACQAEVSRLFHLHRQAETWLANTQPVADVCLIEASPENPGRNHAELIGLITLLSEAHILYDIVEESTLAGSDVERRLSHYPLVIVPDIPHLSPGLVSTLEGYVNNGGPRGARLLLTGLSASASSAGEPLERLAFNCTGISAIRQHPHIPGAYFGLSTQDHALLPALDPVDWIPLDTAWLECAAAEGTQTLLSYIPTGMYGPPEKCYYTETTEHPGVLLNRAGKGICAVLPWKIGDQYGRFPTHALSGLFRDLLDGLLELPRSILVEAPPAVEVSLGRQPQDGSLVLGMVNLSGQNGRSVHAPLPVFDLRFRIQGGGEARHIETLTQDNLPYERMPDGSLAFQLPRLDLLEMIYIR